jgi:hypothetical protein
MPGEFPWIERHRRLLRWSSVAIPLAVVAFILIGYSDIVLVTFSGSVGGRLGGIDQQNLPSGVNVTIRWADVEGIVGHFVVWTVSTTSAPLATVYCSQSAVSGTCSFESTGGLYYFGASTAYNSSINYTGTYYVSLL